MSSRVGQVSARQREHGVQSRALAARGDPARPEPVVPAQLAHRERQPRGRVGLDDRRRCAASVGGTRHALDRAERRYPHLNRAAGRHGSQLFKREPHSGRQRDGWGGSQACGPAYRERLASVGRRDTATGGHTHIVAPRLSPVRLLAMFPTGDIPPP